MVGSRATGGGVAQFTYDFGITIAQSTVNKVVRLTGATLSLASAFYALRNQADRYVSTLRENTLRFGGILSTMKAMEQAQDRLIKGQSYFSVDDQLKGMNSLMAAGINVGKNLEWINKAAHATGKSFEQFSGMIASAIQGNAGALVDAGLMTQRAARMFDKYTANTVMRQQAILNFVKNHKGLMNAIKNDFETIQDQMRRINAIWRSFLQSIIGKPNDPQSLYGQIVSTMKMVAEALSRNVEYIKRAGYIIGNVLGWTIKQIGHFAVWVGKQIKQSIGFSRSILDNYVEFTRSLLVWLEFWKLKIVNFFKEYGGAIKTVLKMLLAYKALKGVLTVGSTAISSVLGLAAAWSAASSSQRKYAAANAARYGKFGAWLRSLVYFLPRRIRYVAANILNTVLNLLGTIVGSVSSTKNTLGRMIWGLKGLLLAPFSIIHHAITGIHIAVLSLARGRVVSAIRALVRVFVRVFSDIWSYTKALFGPVVSFMLSGLRLIGNSILNLRTISKAVFTYVRGLWMSLNATNPVGWIIIAVTLAAVLYKKFSFVRKIVNAAIKSLWEWGKLLYNLIYGSIVGIQVAAKKTWAWLTENVFDPLKKKFSGLIDKVKKLWSAICDSSAVKKLREYVINPLSKLFNKLGGLSELFNLPGRLLSTTNTKLAAKIQEGEESLNMRKSYSATGGNFDMADETDYLSTDSWNFNGLVPTTAKPKDDVTRERVDSVPVNPFVPNNFPESNIPSEPSMKFDRGAIQIIVQKGENIDERKLAQKIHDVIVDLQRKGKIRGGAA